MKAAFIKTFLSFLLLFIAFSGQATHNLGGTIEASQISGRKYEVKVITYTKSSAPADRPSIVLNWGDGKSDSIPRVSIINISGFDLQKNVYLDTHIYQNDGTFYMNLEDINRSSDIDNLKNSFSKAFHLFTGVVVSKGTSNNSSRFLSTVENVRGLNNDSLVVNFNHYDPDGDRLFYELVTPKGEYGKPLEGYTIPNGVSMNPNTGELTWDAAKTGKYTFSIRVVECRNGSTVGSKIFEHTFKVVNKQTENRFTRTSSYPEDPKGNYSFTVTPGDVFDLKLAFRDTFSQDTLEMVDFGEHQDLTNYANANYSFSKVYSSTDSVVKEFTWYTEPSEEKCNPYVLTFRGIRGSYMKDLSILLYINDDTSNCSSPCDQEVLSIKEKARGISSSKGRVYPNPTDGVLNYRYKDLNGRGGVLIVRDLKGRRVLERSIDGRTGFESLDLSDRQSGVYIYEHRSERGRLLNTGKILLEE